jgi:hypothetical protein
MEGALTAVSVQMLRTREALGHWPVLALGWAAACPPVRSQTPYIIEVGTENLGHAPSLSNASARAMGSVAFEDLRDMA